MLSKSFHGQMRIVTTKSTQLFPLHVSAQRSFIVRHKGTSGRPFFLTLTPLRSVPNKILATSLPSRSEHGLSVSSTFKITYGVQFGESLKVVGSSRTFGEWSISGALALTWTEGDVWCGTVQLEPGLYEFKFVVCRDDVAVTWENDPNRALQVPGVSGDLDVECSWNEAANMHVNFTEKLVADDALPVDAQEEEDGATGDGESELLTEKDPALVLPQVTTDVSDAVDAEIVIAVSEPSTTTSDEVSEVVQAEPESAAAGTEAMMPAGDTADEVESAASVVFAVDALAVTKGETAAAQDGSILGAEVQELTDSTASAASSVFAVDSLAVTNGETAAAQDSSILGAKVQESTDSAASAMSAVDSLAVTKGETRAAQDSSILSAEVQELTNSSESAVNDVQVPADIPLVSAINIQGQVEASETILTSAISASSTADAVGEAGEMTLASAISASPTADAMGEAGETILISSISASSTADAIGEAGEMALASAISTSSTADAMGEADEMILASAISASSIADAVGGAGEISLASAISASSNAGAIGDCQSFGVEHPIAARMGATSSEDNFAYKEGSETARPMAVVMEAAASMEDPVDPVAVADDTVPQTIFAAVALEVDGPLSHKHEVIDAARLEPPSNGLLVTETTSRGSASIALEHSRMSAESPLVDALSSTSLQFAHADMAVIADSVKMASDLTHERAPALAMAHGMTEDISSAPVSHTMTLAAPNEAAQKLGNEAELLAHAFKGAVPASYIEPSTVSLPVHVREAISIGSSARESTTGSKEAAAVAVLAADSAVRDPVSFQLPAVYATMQTERHEMPAGHSAPSTAAAWSSPMTTTTSASALELSAASNSGQQYTNSSTADVPESQSGPGNNMALSLVALTAVTATLFSEYSFYTIGGGPPEAVMIGSTCLSVVGGFALWSALRRATSGEGLSGLLGVAEWGAYAAVLLGISMSTGMLGELPGAGAAGSAEMVAAIQNKDLWTYTNAAAGMAKEDLLTAWVSATGSMQQLVAGLDVVVNETGEVLSQLTASLGGLLDKAV